MKLITHNMLQSNVKGVQKGYPLGLRATKLNVLDAPFNEEFVKSMLSRLDYAVLRLAARAVRPLCLSLSHSSSWAMMNFLKQCLTMPSTIWNF
jgi:hypothetical protein